MPITKPRMKRWTRREYYRLVKLGVFDGQHVELLWGRLVQMPPMRNEHAMAITLTEDALRTAFGPGHWIRVQMPLDLTNTCSPEPDVAVAAGNVRDHKDHPTSALIVVEVSESTLHLDRKIKTHLYAFAAIQEYWIVNLVDRQLEVFRDPQPNQAKPQQSRFGQHLILEPDEQLSPLAALQAVVKVADLLP